MFLQSAAKGHAGPSYLPHTVTPCDARGVRTPHLSSSRQNEYCSSQAAMGAATDLGSAPGQVDAPDKVLTWHRGWSGNKPCNALKRLSSLISTAHLSTVSISMCLPGARRLSPKGSNCLYGE